MAFQPVIPMSGIGGWKFLQATYDKQLQSFARSPQVRNERNYMIDKFAEPMSVENFLKDTRLVRAAMTAFDLSGEEWKKGFINKVLKEVGDPESTFLARLNNSKYTAFAKALAPENGMISLSPDQVAIMAVRFERNSFESAVGEIDDNMRLALNYQADIASIVGNGSSDSAIAYRILGDLPISSVLKTALNLPQDTSKLPVERQAEILTTGLKRAFGVGKLSELASPEVVEKTIIRFHAMKSISEFSATSSGASNALVLLSDAGSGFGAGASQNLFLSGLL